ncbi:MAG: glycosyltransferase family 39 protein [Solirubrobacterales bacterium]|nr:glycosyltransferase family 39 protein [Solirubrobacterales bacterium]
MKRLGLAALTPVRALIAAQLAVIVAAGLATVLSLPKFTGDERAHFSYLQSVAEQGRLPLLGPSLISPEVEAIYQGTYPSPAKIDPATLGLSGRSYEAFQPPLYYLLAAIPFRLAGDNYVVKMRVMRLVGLGLLLAAALLLWRLTVEVINDPEEAEPYFAFALTALLWPGIVLRTVTISNSGLEFLIGIGLTLVLWRAWQRRSAGWLIGAAALLGVGLLTRLTIIFFIPGLLICAVAVLRQAQISARTRWLAGAGVVLIPALIMAPWLLSNLDRYGSLTGSRIWRQQQEPSLNPEGIQYALSDIPSRLLVITRGLLPEEWWIELLSALKRWVLTTLMTALVVFAPLGVLSVRPSERRTQLLALLALPVGVGIIWMSYVLLVINWDFFLPRYLYPTIPGLMLLAAVSLGRLRRGARALLVGAAVMTVLLGAWWAYLATVEPFTG